MFSNFFFINCCPALALPVTPLKIFIKEKTEIKKRLFLSDNADSCRLKLTAVVAACIPYNRTVLSYPRNFMA